ncbi:hypothetical protein EKE94_12485 [Mesobaculum littorinae]|uniref:Uncharacterized protein n=1 Tax=Mesobaculum littorinae TaxID=2486419 RepID=A0A438AF90_9RHOB|nr:hypothetical protein [Mesobaculum littorinae]RVV97376.1 hypothetical protein EKE94_12485 [Mesobaculum littorinae]
MRGSHHYGAFDEQAAAASRADGEGLYGLFLLALALVPATIIVGPWFLPSLWLGQAIWQTDLSEGVRLLLIAGVLVVNVTLVLLALTRLPKRAIAWIGAAQGVVLGSAFQPFVSTLWTCVIVVVAAIAFYLIFGVVAEKVQGAGPATEHKS